MEYSSKIISIMSSLTITTVIKMIGCLPENTQNYVLEHLREYIQ